MSAAGHEMRDVVARALCPAVDEPCRFHTTDADIAVIALAEAGYLRHPAAPAAPSSLPLGLAITSSQPLGLTLTGGGAGDTPPAASAAPLDPAAQAGGAIGSPTPPSPQPRRFELYRHSDITGLTGTGVVAWGAQWPDGTASMRWGGKHPSTVAWANVERIIAVHGHQGSTVIRWLDGGS